MNIAPVIKESSQAYRSFQINDHLEQQIKNLRSLMAKIIKKFYFSLSNIKSNIELSHFWAKIRQGIRQGYMGTTEYQLLEISVFVTNPQTSDKVILGSQIPQPKDQEDSQIKELLYAFVVKNYPTPTSISLPKMARFLQQVSW